MSQASKFYDLFRGLDRAYGTYRITNETNEKVKGEARTHIGVVSPELWEKHLNGEQGLGIIPINDDANCIWGAIDIDVYDGLNISSIEKKISSAKLPLVICKTKSGGVHLYLFAMEEVPAELIRKKLVRWAYFLGFPKAEIFPKQTKLASQEDVGNWLNMPYFGGDDTDRFCIKDNENLSVSSFLKYANEQKVSIEFLEKLILTYDDLVIDAPPCLQHLSEIGIQQGSRNNGLFSYAVYASKKWPDEWERRVDRFNIQFVLPPLKSRLVNSIVSSIKKKEYFYKCEDIPLNSICNKTLCLKTPFGVGTKEDDPGIIMTELTKIDTDPPIWIIIVNDQRIQLSNTRHILEQKKFHEICMEKIHFVPKRIKATAWVELINDLLSNLTIVEAPEDAEERGQLWLLIEKFCTNAATQGNHQEELLQGKVWRNNSLLHFRSEDLNQYLITNRTRVSITAIWSELRTRGAISNNSTRFKIKGKQVRCWALPESLFSFQTEEFSVQVPKKEF